MQKIRFPETTSMSLHIMAMAFMLCDHLWVTVIPEHDWLNAVGRIAFPIFSFLIVEGYFHTGNLKKYLLRLLLFALLSEIPFNLAVGSSWSYPAHQNVLWTFLFALLLVHMNELARLSGDFWQRLFTVPATLILGFFLGLITMADYHFAGIYTVLTFYFFRGRTGRNFLLQLIALICINFNLGSYFTYELALFGSTFLFPRQCFALLALIPIWLYRGRQGPSSRALKYFYYAFYPAHLLILGLLQRYI